MVALEILFLAAPAAAAHLARALRAAAASF